MQSRTSYSAPLQRDQFAQALARGWAGAVLIGALMLGGVILAHAAISTLSALPMLTDPNLVPGCC